MFLFWILVYLWLAGASQYLVKAVNGLECDLSVLYIVIFYLFPSLNVSDKCSCDICVRFFFCFLYLSTILDGSNCICYFVFMYVSF